MRLDEDHVAAGIALPAGVVTPAALGCEPGGLAEDYYRTTATMGLPEPAPGQGCGSGAGTHPVPGQLADDVAVDGRVGLSEADGDMVRRHVAEAVREAVESTGKGRHTTSTAGSMRPLPSGIGGTTSASVGTPATVAGTASW